MTSVYRLRCIRWVMTCLSLCGLLLSGCESGEVPPVCLPAPALVDFAREVQPIFAQHCYECHGPVEEEGGLRLDLLDRVLAGGKSGSVTIVPGDRAASLLYQYITGQNDDHVIMPPKDRGEPLSPAECEVVGKWIDGLARGEGLGSGD